MWSQSRCPLPGGFGESWARISVQIGRGVGRQKIKPQLKVVLLLFTCFRRYIWWGSTYRCPSEVNNLGCYFENGTRFNQDLRTGQKSGIPIARLNRAGSKALRLFPQEALMRSNIPPKKKNPPIPLLAIEVFFGSSFTRFLILILSINNESRNTEPNCCLDESAE